MAFSRAHQAPHRERLRCALACAHAARRVYEHRRVGDARLRASLALISEVAAGGSYARNTATSARLRMALEALREASKNTDALSGLVLATTMDAFEAALAVLNRKPWRLVDEHARRAYMRADHAVSQAYVEAAQRGPEAIAALGHALAGQDLRAFAYARSLWLPALEGDEPRPPVQDVGQPVMGSEEPVELAARAEELTQEIAAAPLPSFLDDETEGNQARPALAMGAVDPAALAILENTPAALAALLGSLPPDALTGAREGEWSATEALAHLHDTESGAFTERIGLMLAEERPFIRSIDPPARLRDGGYTSRTAVELLEEWTRARAEHVAWLRGLSRADLARVGEHDEAGEIIVRDIIHQWAYHDLMHLGQIMAQMQQRLAQSMGNTRRFYGLPDA